MAFDETTKKLVWGKGTIANPNNPGEWRKDECGAWIEFSRYGDRNSQYGWEIDHITSVDHGGTDALSNLRPLQWQNNASKNAGRLVCVVTANGTNNKSN
jgi:hypothetical protein